MEEKKKRNEVKEQETSSFPEDTETRRLQNIFGEALGDFPLPEEVQSEWNTFIQKQKEKRKKLYLRIWLSGSVAAAIILILLLWSPWQQTETEISGIEIFASLKAPEHITTTKENGRIIVSTPPSTLTHITLEDGSHVILGANSRFEYPEKFTSPDKRMVSLTGEARFEVTKDISRPFIVTAGKIQTRVLGTVFDVNAYPASLPAVTLYEGCVQLTDTVSTSSRKMSPGQHARLAANGDILLSKVSWTKEEGWTQGEFYFDNIPMKEVLQEIGTWYNISIICHSASLLQERIHFRFSRNVPVGNLLAALNDLGIAEFQYKEKRIIVK